MNRRPESSRNGKSELNGKGTYPIIEMRRTVQPRVYSYRPPSLLPLVILCATAGLGIAIFMGITKQPEASQPIPESEAFRWAVNRAMSAAQLTQTAQSPEEWQQVTTWWKEAVELMQAVPPSDDKHEVALAKVTEYQNNFLYAQGRLKVAPNQSGADDLWGIGSRRAAVLKLQGMPTEIDRYDSMCKEVLHYGKSKVELNNGLVATYEDFDRKLKVAAADLPLATPESGSSWDLGSTKEQVFKIQGTPTRISQYDYSDRETLYYGNSIVELAKERVIGYINQSSNLRVRTVPILANTKSSSSVWTLESSREDLLRVQGTPTQVLLDNPACTETFHYGNSTITLKNGHISGYDNLDNNLRVRAK